MLKVLESIGKPVWLVLMILGFMWFWPIGLAIFVYLVWSYGSFTQGFPWQFSFWTSGNSAFDNHYKEAIAALETEKKEFSDFVKEKLSEKDQAEFAEFKSKHK